MRRIIINESGEPVGWTTAEQSEDTVEVPMRPCYGGGAVWNGSAWEYTDADTGIQELEETEASYSGETSYFRAVRRLQEIWSAIIPLSSGKSWRLAEGEKVDVLIPCYGKAAYVKEAVQSCIDQTRRPDAIRVLLMDSESIAMKEELESLSELVICEESGQLNASAARMRMADGTDAEWIVFLDADDFLEENFIEVTGGIECAVCYPQISILEDGVADDFRHNPVLPDSHPACALCQNLTALMRREVFTDMGLDESLASGGEDLDFLLRLLKEKEYLVAHTSDTRYYWRQNVEGQLTDSSDFLVSYLRMIEKNSEFITEELEECGNLPQSLNPALWLLKNWSEENLAVFSRSRCLSCSDGWRELLDDLAPYAVNGLRELIEESRSRETDSVHDESYVTVGNPRSEEFFDEYDGRRFDAVIFYTHLEQDPFDAVFRKTADCVVSPEVFGALQSADCANELDMIYFLLRNYSCFMFPGNLDQAFSMNRREETWQRLRAMRYAPERLSAALDTQESDMLLDMTVTSVKRPLQKVTFILSRRCNLSCAYCSQSGLESEELSDDEMYGRFDTLLSKAEELTGGRLVPQLMGGEPSLWSESLQQRIVDRLKSYRRVFLFTNGTDRTGLFFRQPNFFFITHITDWKEKTAADIEQLPNEMSNICVLRSELGEVEEFMERIQGSGLDIYFQPCSSDRAEWDMDGEAVIRLAQMQESHDIWNTLSGFASDIELNGADYARKECAACRGVWNADCSGMTVSPCCNLKNAVPLEEFTEAAAKDCTGCLNWGNTVV